MLSLKSADILKPKFLAPAFFAGLGGWKTYNDYKQAKPKNKKYVLTKDTVILTASAAGYLAATAIVKKAPRVAIVDSFVRLISKPFKKLIPKSNKYMKPLNKAPQIMHKSMNHLEQAVKDCLAATIITGSAILAAFGGNEIVSRYIFKKHSKAPLKTKEEPKEKKAEDKKNIDIPKIPEHVEAELSAACTQSRSADVLDEAIEQIDKLKEVNEAKKNYLNYLSHEFTKDPANKVFTSVSFLPVLKALEFPMAAVQGFDMTREKGVTEKIKKTSYSLIANTFVPTFFISIATALTRGVKNIVRFPIIAASTLAGIAAGTIAGKYAENKLQNNLHLK